MGLPLKDGRWRARASLCALLLLAGCAGAGGSAPRGAAPASGGVRQAPAANGVLAIRVERAPARDAPGQGAPALAQPVRPFSPNGVWNRALPAGAPLDPRSAELVAALDREVAQEQAAKSGPWINTTSYGVPILTVAAGQPTVAVHLDHAPEPSLSAAWSAVPLPADAQPSAGTDASLVVWQPSSDRMWEFWRLARRSDGWHAAWGGAIMHASSNPGVFGPEAWPGAHTWWGVSASSLALAGGTITIEDLRRGKIEHALALAVPEVRAGLFASPAQRTDGQSASPLALAEGTRLRLDPRLDIASLPMPPLVREIALAAQRYGILVRDFAGVVVFYAQDPTSGAVNPYSGPEGFFAGQSPSQLLAYFPWSHLQVLKLDLHPNP